jgi:serine/threonine-protein kinase
MPVRPGDRLGPYDIVAPLGAGGMGEVYRARDTRLDRTVAIKILPEALAGDSQFRERFGREAKAISQLAHPHICTLFDVGHQDPSTGSGQAVDYLVLEFLDGETLAVRLARSKEALPLNEALTIAIQIADALAAAHRAGIVHRDLKPGNVMLVKSGSARQGSPQAKLLDFGLAKTAPAAPAVRAGAPTLTSPPTMTIPLTMAGSILGTFHYMSPEQLEGGEADSRSDIFSFGAVVYEMLAGEKAFSGKSPLSVMAAILDREPPSLSSVPAIPPALSRLVRKCLAKDPDARWQTARDVASELEWIRETLAQAPSSPGATTASGPRRRREALWIAAALAMTAVAAGLTWILLRPGAARQQPPMRVSAELGIDGSFIPVGGGNGAALSADGSLLVFTAQPIGGRPQLYVRRIEQLQAIALSGTEDAGSPFLSPDGQWIGFVAGTKLKKIAVTGGAVVTLADAPTARGAWWGDDDTIVFEPAREGVSLMRISSSGGTPTPVGTLADGEVTQRWPQVLPGSRAVLFTGHTIAAGGFDNANLVVQSLPGGPRKIVQRGGMFGRYVASGHLLYVHEGTLFAAPFDLDRLEVSGPAVPVTERISANPGSGSAQYAVSGAGTLAYVPGQSVIGTAIHWLDRQGRVTPLRATPSNWSDLRFSPDGTQLAMAVIRPGGATDVGIYDWARDRFSPITSDSANDTKPVWTPDGRRIVFGSNRAGTMNLYWQRTDGSGEIQRLTDSTGPPHNAGSWHPNGKVLAFREVVGPSGDLFTLTLEGDETSGWKPGKPTPFVVSPFNEHDPMFSPDGRWIAYSSDESGREEVYVRPFPSAAGRWLISTEGGLLPTWSRARNELFYSTLDQRIMVTPYTVEGEAFRPGKPAPWTETRYRQRGATFLRSFDLHPDGERFAVAADGDGQPDAPRDTIVFVFNFFDELRRVAPAKR